VRSKLKLNPEHYPDHSAEHLLFSNCHIIVTADSLVLIVFDELVKEFFTNFSQNRTVLTKVGKKYFTNSSKTINTTARDFWMNIQNMFYQKIMKLKSTKEKTRINKNNQPTQLL
jgi:hypothetical protein